MPIYEYKCKKCGEIYEVVQKIDDKPLKTCKDEKCEGKLEKLISKSSFKIEGYSYANDYSKPSPKRKPSPERK